MPFWKSDGPKQVGSARALSKHFQGDKKLQADMKKLAVELDLRIEEALKLLMLDSIDRDNVDISQLSKKEVIDAVTDFLVRKGKTMSGLYVRFTK